MKILIFGSKGLVGSAVSKHLKLNRDFNIIKSERSDTNLFSLNDTKLKIIKEKPDIVIIAAAKVGGIYANNTQRFNFLTENLKINLNIYESLINYPEIKIINIGSSCIYPLNVKNPIKEESLMTGKLEPTNSPYAMSKLTAVELGKSMNKQFGHKVINLMPTNLYGPNDKFDEMNSHVIPGLIFKMHKAKIQQLNEVEIWGSGNPLREFMHVDDLASAINFIILNNINEEILNVGTNKEISIKKLAFLIKSITKYSGNLKFNNNYPDGNPRKLLDSSKINHYGWYPKITLENGIKNTYKFYISNL